ncbi:glycosyltransferase [Cellulomonas sp. HZM]|uniref:glycosyltransferase n=1 Tax=Cellulomonas sp. HZM TaxID=1454010 RepID=UPI000492EF67|nr:glycosyltransferase [Cellulomonas sp. HZM]
MTETFQPVVPTTTTSTTPTTAPVTAVVVTRGLTEYLPTTLAALAGQTRRPLRVVLVDVADHAGSAGPDRRLADLLDSAVTAAGGHPRPMLVTVAAPGVRTFGAAVRRALADGAEGDGVPATWLWLLHDDSAPEPTALAELARAVNLARSVGVAGVKQSAWDDPDRILEAGVRTSRSGRRMTGVEPGELDQGQHDARDDVLGVGLAGALVRRDVWDALRGTDPVLGPFGDGPELSRRTRLAGHRVVVVPSAVVRHAQASLRGTRSGAEPDERRSYRARRRALVHQRLAGAPLLLLPVVAVLALAVGVVRSLVQLAAKQPGLAVDELRAPLEALARPVAVVRARAAARRTRVLPRRTLHPLQATWADVWRQARDRQLARAEARKVVRAPSELERRELAAITTRRRVTLGAVALVLALVAVVALGPLVSAVAGGARLVGSALAPATSGLGALWSAATSGWVADGLGAPGPADPLLGMLAAPSAVVGGRTGAVVASLVLAAVLLAGLGAWAAAGAATRSTGVRAWAAVVWAGAPALLLAVGDGRLGPVVAHVALPWVALGAARAVGVQRVDQVLSGLATASHEDGDVDVRREVEVGREVEEADVVTPARGVAAGLPDVPGPRRPGDATEDGAGAIPAGADDHAAARAEGLLVGAPDPTGSIAAAAGAALAFVLVAVGAPVLALPAAAALVVWALCAPRARGRLLLVPVPALVVLGPTLVEAASRGAAGWRLLVAGPGVATAADTAGSLQRLLGVPADASAVVPGWASSVAEVWPLALGGVVLVLALLALLRGAPFARAVRVAWVVAAIGLGVATLVARVPVGTQDGAVVHGWTGSALSLAGAGLLAAAVLGTDRLQDRLGKRSFGWRQPVVALVTVVAVLVPVAWLGGWAWEARTGDAVALGTLDDPVVPAVGQQAQTGPDRSRVLAIAAEARHPGAGPAVSWQLFRGDGPQLVDQAAAVSTRALGDDLTSVAVASPDAATSEVQDLVARLVAGSAQDAAPPLASLAVSDVLVPPARGGDAARRARDELVARLDATDGLERVSQGAAGTLWRVQDSSTDVVTAWARTVQQGEQPSPGLGSPVPAGDRDVDTRVPASTSGRTLVLAERADAHWRAWLDGRSLRAVDAGWRQAFDLGSSSGHLVVRYDAPQRTPWLVAQGVVLLVTVLLAVPVRRRRGVRA